MTKINLCNDTLNLTMNYTYHLSAIGGIQTSIVAAWHIQIYHHQNMKRGTLIDSHHTRKPHICLGHRVCSLKLSISRKAMMSNSHLRMRMAMGYLKGLRKKHHIFGKVLVRVGTFHRMVQVQSKKTTVHK